MYNMRLRLLLPLCLLVLVGCVHQIGEAVQTGNAHRWAGPVIPSDPGCRQQTTGVMRLNSKEFAFDPFGSTMVIQGKVEEDHLEGSSTMAAPGQKGITTQFTGTITHSANEPAAIQGTMTSGQCTWRVTLHRS
jgi:hypothetical protein